MNPATTIEIVPVKIQTKVGELLANKFEVRYINYHQLTGYRILAFSLWVDRGAALDIEFRYTVIHITTQQAALWTTDAESLAVLAVNAGFTPITVTPVSVTPIVLVYTSSLNKHGVYL
jgi:hypothetical protein